jgi:predicted SprT family Zn-dependent metalloprotease
MQTMSRSNECRLGRTGRRRSYVCRSCGERFTTDFRHTAMPEKDRLCHDCTKERILREASRC